MAFTVNRSRSIISAMIHGREVTAMDVAWLRREVFPGGVVWRDAADELFAVERAGVGRIPQWTELLVEMITEHVLWQSEPSGEIDEDRARWLIDQADSCASANALAVLVNALGEARSAPRWFIDAVRDRSVRNWAGVQEALSTAAE
jgi:hypothetical protein